MATKITTPPTADILAAAYDKHLDTFRALRPEDVLKRIHVDLPTAIAVALGAQPGLLRLRAEIREKLPAMPLRYIDDLDTLAHAALYVHMQVSMSVAPDRLAKLADDAKNTRKLLMADAVAASHRGLVDARALEEIPSGNGRLEIAQAIVGLVVLFRAAWPRVQGQSGVTEKELDSAARLGVDLLTALGQEDNPASPEANSAREALRLRAFTVLFRAYDECRRAVAWLRWHEDDATDFAPPLGGSRAHRAKRTETDDGDEPADPTPNPPDGKPPTG